MTVRGELQSVGIRAGRANWRTIVRRAEEGTATVLLRNAEPLAVLLRFDEARRWQQVEQGLAALHALGVYPEAGRDPGELAAFVRGDRALGRRRLRHAQNTPRPILGGLKTIAVSDVPGRFASVMDEVASGSPITVVSGGNLTATLVPPHEYERLRALVLVDNWFRAAGLDLAQAEPEGVVEWLRRFREGDAVSRGQAS